ncbi:MAG: hypothetical protein HY721_34960 [Planctomycetes bacterium]|nr:hypothetical protein [Planctomycetota bacterium]
MNGRPWIPGCVSPTGEELFFVRGPGVSLDLWAARFVEPHNPFAGFMDVCALTHLKGPEQLVAPAISADGRYLVWSERPQSWPSGMPPRPGGGTAARTSGWPCARRRRSPSACP